MKLFHSISFLFLITFTVSAQKEATERETTEKETTEKEDTVKQKKDFRPTGIRGGTDVIALIKSSTDETFKGWEINGDIDFYRYYFAVDFGYWGRNFQTDEGNYSNDGTYYRVGADVNFLTKDPDRNMFYLGLRYGASTFSEELVIQSIDPVWGPISTTLNNSNVNAHWYELTTGLKVKMWKMIWLGYTVRLKFALSTDATGDMLPSDVPGYGRADAESYWGFNYQIFIRLPIRKTDSILLKK